MRAFGEPLPTMEGKREKVRKTLILRLFLYKRAKRLYLGRRCFLRPRTSMARYSLGRDMREPSRREEESRNISFLNYTLVYR